MNSIDFFLPLVYIHVLIQRNSLDRKGLPSFTQRLSIQDFNKTKYYFILRLKTFNINDKDLVVDSTSIL